MTQLISRVQYSAMPRDCCVGQFGPRELACLSSQHLLKSMCSFSSFCKLLQALFLKSRNFRTRTLEITSLLPHILDEDTFDSEREMLVSLWPYSRLQGSGRARAPSHVLFFYSEYLFKYSIWFRDYKEKSTLYVTYYVILFLNAPKDYIQYFLTQMGVGPRVWHQTSGQKFQVSLSWEVFTVPWLI